MRKIQLLVWIAALFAVMAGVVVYTSPYAPVVQPVMEIEEIWAIEDSRRESDAPLVTCLENHGMRLGYDAQENTFYCPIGLDTGDEWPQLHLTAPGARGVQLVFVDDYSYLSAFLYFYRKNNTLFLQVPDKVSPPFHHIHIQL